MPPKLGKSFVYLGDEFYILAGMPLPEAEWYDGFPQAGKRHRPEPQFFWKKAGAGKIAPVKGSTNSVIPVGTSAYKVLQPLIEEFNAKTGMQHKLLAVENEFFGNTVNVTGLLCGNDILNAVKGAESVILPEVVLNSDNLFLDDMSYAEFAPPAERRAQGCFGRGFVQAAAKIRCCYERLRYFAGLYRRRQGQNQCRAGGGVPCMRTRGACVNAGLFKG